MYIYIKLRSVHVGVNMLHIGRSTSYCVLLECAGDISLTKVRQASESLRSLMIVFLCCTGLILGKSIV